MIKLIFTSAIAIMISGTASAQVEPIANIHKQLNGTQWIGRAGIPNEKGGMTWLSIPAKMSFEVMDGRLFYLSKILGPLDAGIEKKAQGLCVKSPPREAVLHPSEDGKKIDGKVVLADVVSELGKMNFYSIPIENLVLSQDKLTFHSILKETTSKKGKLRQIRITYELSKGSSDKTIELAKTLTNCLNEKPWEVK